MTDQAVLDATVRRVLEIADRYRQDAPYKAPEVRWEGQVRLLNDLHAALEAGHA